MTNAHYILVLVCQFLLPAASVLIMGTLPGSDGGQSLTSNEIVTAVAACIVATSAASHRGRHAGAGYWAGDPAGPGAGTGAGARSGHPSGPTG